MKNIPLKLSLLAVIVSGQYKNNCGKDCQWYASNSCHSVYDIPSCKIYKDACEEDCKKIYQC